MLELIGIVQLVGSNYKPLFSKQLILDLLVRSEKIDSNFDVVVIEFEVIAFFTGFGLPDNSFYFRRPTVVFLSLQIVRVVGGALQCVHAWNF